MTDMKTYFHPDQRLHRPASYFSRGQMRTPQEIPERVDRILAGLDILGLTLASRQTKRIGVLN